MARATMIAVLMRLPDLDDPIRVAEDHNAITKAGFNSDEPRDERGRWTNSGADANRRGRDAGAQLADAGMSDAIGDPVAEAAAQAAASARANQDHSQPKSQHEDFWETLGNKLSDRTKALLFEIGNDEARQDINNFTTATITASGAAHALRDYGNYRAQPWIGPDGTQMRVSTIEMGDPLSDRAALIGHDLFEPNAPLTRPATNADWIDPLINLASMGVAIAVPPIRLAGPALEVLDASEVAATSVNAADYIEGNFTIYDWSGYPDGLSQPNGPFRLLEGREYEAARTAANSANRALREADPEAYVGKQIHEIHPVKFGGNPTDPLNKVALTPKQHATVTTWWNQLLRKIQ
jgi:hypothetical protein